MCADCRHPEAVHKPDGCRVTGCPCEGFTDPPEPEPAKPPRKVCVDVPDGYTVIVTLTPGDDSD